MDTRFNVMILDQEVSVEKIDLEEKVIHLLVAGKYHKRVLNLAPVQGYYFYWNRGKRVYLKDIGMSKQEQKLL